MFKCKSTEKLQFKIKTGVPTGNNNNNMVLIQLIISHRTIMRDVADCDSDSNINLHLLERYSGFKCCNFSIL